MQHARELFNKAKYEECFQAVSGYLQRDPASAEGYKILGLDEYMLGRSKDALAHVTRATELAPGDSEAFYYLGRLYFSTDNPEAALTPLRRAIVLDASSVRARNHLGQSLEALGRYSEAEAAYAEAIQAGEKQASALQWPYYNLGLLYLHDGRADESVALLRKALVCNPRFIEARLKLAMALSAQNHLAEAQNLLEDVLRTDPHNAEAHYRLGVVLSKSGKQPEAKEQFGLFEKNRKR
jgi:Flp pilus assembly protein TadD